MTGKTNGKNGIQERAGEIQAFVVTQLEDARKQLVRFEKEVVARGKAQRKEIEKLLTRAKSGKDIEQLKKSANEAAHEVTKLFDGIQHRLVEAVGVASKDQVEQIKGDLNRLTKKIDALLKKPSANN
jgi:ribosomal protein L17